jgi:2-oxoglutarate ferredoxin oxidoreductase subunit gamma
MIEELIFAGFGGQGILLGGRVIAQAAMSQGMNATWFPSYGPEMRGGTANCLVAYADDEIGSPIFGAFHAALIMNLPSLDKFGPMIRKGGLLVANTSLIALKEPRTDVQIVEVRANDLARQAGSDRAANLVMVGAYSAVQPQIKPETFEQLIRETFAGKGDQVVSVNLRAFEAGRQAAAGVAA